MRNQRTIGMLKQKRRTTINPISTHKIRHIYRSSETQNCVIEAIWLRHRCDLSERNVERASARSAEIVRLDHQEPSCASKFPSQNHGAGGVSASSHEFDPTPRTTRGGSIIIASPIASRARHACHDHHHDDYCTTGGQASESNQDYQAQHDQPSTDHPLEPVRHTTSKHNSDQHSPLLAPASPSSGSRHGSGDGSGYAPSPSAQHKIRNATHSSSAFHTRDRPAVPPLPHPQKTIPGDIPRF